MKSLRIDLYRASDNEETFAIRLQSDPGSHSWRAESGYGGQFLKVWSVDYELPEGTELENQDWNALLLRTVEAFHLSDPVVALPVFRDRDKTTL